MKKLTISLPDSAEVDFGVLAPILSQATDVRLETDTSEGVGYTPSEAPSGADGSRAGGTPACTRDPHPLHAGAFHVAGEEGSELVLPLARRKYYRRADMSTLECVMRHFFHGGEVTRETVARWLSHEGFSQNSASPALARLVAAGLMVRVGRGRWRFRKQAPEGVRLTSRLAMQMAAQQGSGS